MACREYTLPREEGASQPQGYGSKGTSRLGVYREVVTSYLHGKYGVEIRIWSMNSLLGQTLSWIKQVCDEFEQQ